jgi:uncharacterized protein YcaQ
VLGELLASGEVVEIAVDDEQHGARKGTPWYVLARDLPALSAAAGRRAPSRGTTMLAPFDSLLWHRERTERLFGFSYKIEVYTPGAKRVHGYYVLPILCHGQLIGRLDAKSHRRDRRLEVKRIHFEPWFAQGRAPPAARWGTIDIDEGLAGVADALHDLAAFVGAERVEVTRVAPSRLGRPLAHALHTSLRSPASIGR